jgi:putative oxidoreductase
MSTTYEKCSWAYENFATIASALRSPMLLAIRLYWGIQFAQTGWGKLQNMERVTGYFATLGIPFPHANAIFISGLELAGGILLIFGLGSRLTALLLAGDMVVAYVVADQAALRAIFSDPSTFFNASPFTFLFASLLILVLGPGIASIDALIARAHRRKMHRQGANVKQYDAGLTRIRNAS